MKSRAWVSTEVVVQMQRDILGSVFFFFSSRRRHTRFDCDWSSDVCSSDLDGSSDPESLLAADRAVYAAGWSRDGLLVYSDVHPTNQFDIWVKPLGREPRAVLATPAHEVDPALSPDGRWLAYDSNESGRREIYVRPFPAVDTGKWLVSTAGGRTPVWSPTGNELFYSNGSNVMAV